MNWVLFWILLGFGICNLLGMGIYHYQYAHETHKVDWKKDKSFWLWTVYTLLLGTGYVIILGIILIINKLRG